MPRVTATPPSYGNLSFLAAGQRRDDRNSVLRTRRCAAGERHRALRDGCRAALLLAFRRMAGPTRLCGADVRLSRDRPIGACIAAGLRSRYLRLGRSEEHTSELQLRENRVFLLLI